MAFGSDISALLHEIGASVIIVRSAGNIIGEKLIPKSSKQASSLFIREYVVEATCSHITQIVPGDIVQFSGNTYLCVSVTPREFEGSIYDKQVLFYKTNTTASLYYYNANSGYDSNYNKLDDWVVTYLNVPILITEEASGNSIDEKSEAGLLQNRAMEIYLPRSYNTQLLNRFLLPGNEKYKVQGIDKYKFSDIDICHVELDTR